MSDLIIKKVTALPLTYTPSTLYAVPNTDPDLLDLYMSSSDG